MNITLRGMQYLREPERARKGPKGPDEASVNKVMNDLIFLLAAGTLPC